MQHLISFLFITEFFLLLIFFMFNLLKRDFTFKLGICFGLLFFVFLPLWVMIFSGEIKLAISGFGNTGIKNVIMKNNIQSSIVLILFIFSIILYLYLPQLKIKENLNNKFKPLISSYIISYIIGMGIIFIGSGLLKGGNWYDNRHNFFESSGSLAVLVAFVLNSSKILIIASLFYKWLNKDYGVYKFFTYVFSFVILDMFFTGNRIYLFCAAITVGLIFLKRFPKRMFNLSPIILPVVFFLGYFASIFKHMRGPLFEQGIPTFSVFVASLLRAISLEPPKVSMFFLEISESINMNVLYLIFNSYDKFLYGSTYLKPLFFYLPRSIWTSKPESITTLAAKEFGGASLVTTIIGEMYMNFYLFGIILTPIFLLIMDYLFTKLLKNFGAISGIILFIFGVLIFRMPFSDEFLVFIFLWIILVITSWLNKYKFKYKSLDEVN